MREILFRGKESVTKEWVEGYYFATERTYIIKESLLIEVDPETVGQYTGLTDINGKKIFEGDILLTDFSNPYSVVIFKNGCFMQRLEDCGDIFYDIFYPTGNEDTNIYKYNSVCGNIHDNPELLEEMK